MAARSIANASISFGLVTVIQAKVQGKDITAPAPQKRKAEVVDLMEALRASLARKGQASRAPRAVAEPARRVAGRKK